MLVMVAPNLSAFEREKNPAKIIDWYRDVKSLSWAILYFKQRLGPNEKKFPRTLIPIALYKKLLRPGGLLRRVFMEAPHIAREIRFFACEKKTDRALVLLHIEDPHPGELAEAFFVDRVSDEDDRLFLKWFKELRVMCREEHERWVSQGQPYFHVAKVPRSSGE